MASVAQHRRRAGCRARGAVLGARRHPPHPDRFTGMGDRDRVFGRRDSSPRQRRGRQRNGPTGRRVDGPAAAGRTRRRPCAKRRPDCAEFGIAPGSGHRPPARASGVGAPASEPLTASPMRVGKRGKVLVNGSISGVNPPPLGRSRRALERLEGASLCGAAGPRTQELRGA